QVQDACRKQPQPTVHHRQRESQLVLEAGEYQQHAVASVPPDDLYLLSQIIGKAGLAAGRRQAVEKASHDLRIAPIRIGLPQTFCLYLGRFEVAALEQLVERPGHLLNSTHIGDLGPVPRRDPGTPCRRAHAARRAATHAATSRSPAPSHMSVGISTSKCPSDSSARWRLCTECPPSAL